MKKAKQGFNLKLKIFGSMVLLFMAVMAFATDVETGAALTMATVAAVAIPSLTEKEKAFLEHVKTEVSGQMEKFDKGYMSETKFNEILNEKMKGWIDRKPELIDELKQAVETQGLELKKIKDGGGKPVTKSFGQAVFDAYKDKIEAIKALRDTKGMLTLSTKSAATMTLSNVTGADGWLTNVDPAVGKFQRRRPYLKDIINTWIADSHYIKYVDMANADGGADATGENTSKSGTDFDMVVTTAEIKKITAHTRVSEEMIEDVPFMQGHIQNELTELVNLKLDEQILSGTGLTVYLKGILEFSTAFSVTDAVNDEFYQKIEGAAPMDVLRVAIALIAKANFNPTHIILHPSDAALMDLNKLTTGQYELPAFYGLNGVSIKGVPIIENTGMTAGTFLVGDFSKSNLVMREDLNIRVGYDGSDFSKNLISVIAELRGAHYIKTNHTGAFVDGTFSTCAAMLETSATTPTPTPTT